MLRKILTAIFLTSAVQLTGGSVQAQQAVSLATEPELLHHSLKVILDPLKQQISVQDTISLPQSMQGTVLTFALNSNLTITDNSGNLQALPANAASNSSSNSSSNSPSNSPASAQGINGLAAASSSYTLTLPRRNPAQLQLSYNGMVYDNAQQSSPEYAQSFSETSGIISEQGVYLHKGSAWIADFGSDLLSFDLEVEFAETAGSWIAVSQGDRAANNSWRSDQPMEEVYLIAAAFTEYSQQAEDVEVLAYLRQADSSLAAKYMDATARYLALYEPLLGEYPYSKFALVENFWETGYGMPSFTLLGEQVIRFPFILESSYPHELLHNWWGNGVYPDYASGNWSEGLTAYLADHLFQEMEGAGPAYRKEMLARYKNYVAEGTDFPLLEFTARNSAASQAVGYGKTLMLWHMLRGQLGDDLFLEGLRTFYQDYKFQRASFTDIARHFSNLSGIDLSLFFTQWVDRTGAPELSVSVEEANGNRARIMFAQIQSGDPYRLKVPIALYYAGSDVAEIFDIDLTQKLEGVMADDYEHLQAILVDPYFDVFRTLDREETPPTIGELFGASQITFVLPQTDRQYWVQMAESFAQGVDAQIVFADEIEILPEDRSVWILGRDNPFAATVFASAEVYAVSSTEAAVTVDGSELAFEDRSSVIVARHPANPELAVAWIHIDKMVAMPGMIEKLPHYGKYSYLSFVGDEPTNDVKGVWSSPESPLQWIKPETTASINFSLLPAVEPLAVLPAKYMPEQLLRHVSQLSSARLQGRGLGSAGLNEAALYIADQFAAAGLQTLGGTFMQQWTQMLPGRGATEMANVVGMIAGSNRELSAKPLVIAAHFDHLGIDAETGQHFPGADDNGAGISVLIEVASKLSRGFTPQRPILFVAFTGEESGLLGSQYFVNNPPGGFQTKDFLAMINLDSVGRLEGRSLQIFATDSAYEWPFMAQGIGFTLGIDSTFPATTIASSDHVSFLNAGVPAIHLFSGVHADYHQISDTPDKLDLRGLSDIALWLEEAVVYLADLSTPLRSNLAGAQVPVQSAIGEREASLGTVPDFAYVGEGVRISGVSPGSAADEAGLQAGDVLLSYDQQALKDLQTYSNLLRQSAPGDKIRLQVQRAQQRLSVEAVLKAR